MKLYHPSAYPFVRKDVHKIMRKGKDSINEIKDPQVKAAVLWSLRRASQVELQKTEFFITPETNTDDKTL